MSKWDGALSSDRLLMKCKAGAGVLRQTLLKRKKILCLLSREIGSVAQARLPITQLLARKAINWIIG
jgi:hypothetical protein